MATIIGIAKNASGVDQTTPFEGGVSGSGGALGYASAIPFPTVTKTTSGAVICAALGASVLAGSTTANYPATNPTGYSGTTQGPFASPNVGLNTMGYFFETTPSATGTYSGISATTPANTGGTAGRQIQSYATRITCLRPAVVGTAPIMRNSALVNTSGSSVTFTIATTGAANPMTWIDFDIDDPAAAVTPPDGTWTQGFRQTHAGGVLVRYYKATGGGTFTFTVATSTVPTVNSAAIVSAAHSPALVGDTLNVDTATSYSAPSGHAISLYERIPQILDPSTGWGNVTGVDYTSATQGGLTAWPITSAADGLSVRYASRAQNDVGWSDWSYSNGVTVLNAPVVATAPAIVTDGTPQDSETVSVDVSPSARSTRYTGASIDTYETKWQDDTSGSYADISGATGSTLLLTTGQVGKNVRFAERAHNASGYSAWNNSTPIAVTAHPAIAATDVLFRFSGGTGNTSGPASIGGGLGGNYYRSGDSSTALLDALFGAIPGSVAAAGGDLYRVVYVTNSHTIDSLLNVKAFIGTQYPASGLTLSVAVAGAKNTVITALASGTTAPSGITFTTSSTAGGGQSVGTLAPGDYCGLYVKLHVTAGRAVLPTPGSFAAFSVAET